MNSKERMMRALRREVPDRLPVTVHQWQGYHLHNFMEGITDIEACRVCGLDAAITRIPLVEGGYEPWGGLSAEWRVEIEERVAGDACAAPASCRTEVADETAAEAHPAAPATHAQPEWHYTITTPAGVLTMARCSSAISIWVSEHLVKRDEDVELIDKYMPMAHYDKAQLARDYDAIGDDGILRSFMPSFQPGPWQDAIEMHGMQNMIMATFDKPDWVHRFLEIITQRRLRFIAENLRGSKMDLMEFGGGGASSTVISPAIFEEFVLPYDKRVIAAIHDAGIPVVYHTCGGMTAIQDLIWRNGCDASETLTPQSMGGDITDPAAIKRGLGSHVALIGGVDQQHVLKCGSDDDIRRHVRGLFGTYGEGGGYMCCPSDHFFDVPVDKLKTFARAGADCRY